jgi:hypothetical protein
LTAVYIGSETRQGVQVEHLRLSKAILGLPDDMQAIASKLSSSEVFLDSTSHLPVAITFNLHPDDDYETDIPVEIRYSDYRLVNGVTVPFSIKRYLNGGQVQELSIQNVAINSGVSVSDFILQ